ncbi:C45 family peptidase [Lachnospiraceae bacterium 62-35]
MYHAHFRGTHYEAGFRWGSQLLKHNHFILDHIPFEVTKERIDYALSCLPIYEEFYPEILEEIQGLAYGQRSDVRILQAVLLSMYAIPPACNCSCFAVSTEDSILLGRNSDFLTDLEKLNMNVIYRLSDGSYSFTGNTTAFIEIEDGINEYGLAAGLTSVFPVRRKEGFNAGLLLRYMLEKCRTVSEAVSCIQRLPVGSAQTFTLADSGGEIAVIECNGERSEVRTSFCNHEPLVCATNRFHLSGMEDLNQLEIDDWFAETRYQTLITALRDNIYVSDLSFAQRLLAGDYGFLCQYDRSSGKDTVWSVIYDLKQKKIYRSEKNPRYGKFKEDLRFQLI